MQSNGVGLIIKKIVDAFVTVPELKFLGKILLGTLALIIVFLILRVAS